MDAVRFVTAQLGITRTRVGIFVAILAIAITASWPLLKRGREFMEKIQKEAALLDSKLKEQDKMLEARVKSAEEKEQEEEEAKEGPAGTGVRAALKALSKRIRVAVKEYVKESFGWMKDVVDPTIRRGLVSELSELPRGLAMQAMGLLLLNKLISAYSLVFARGAFLTLMFSQLEKVISGEGTLAEKADRSQEMFGTVLQSLFLQIALDLISRITNAMHNHALIKLRADRTAVRRRRYMRHLLRLPESIYSVRQERPLSELASEDPAAVDEFILEQVPTIISVLLDAVVALVAMLHIDTWLSVYTLAIVLPIQSSVWTLTWKVTQPLTSLRWKSASLFDNNVREAFDNIAAVQALGAEDVVLADIERESERCDFWQVATLWPRSLSNMVSSTISSFVNVGQRALAVYRALYAGMPITDFLRFEEVAGRLQSAYSRLTEWQGEQFQRTLKSVRRYLKFKGEYLARCDLLEQQGGVVGAAAASGAGASAAAGASSISAASAVEEVVAPASALPGAAAAAAGAVPAAAPAAGAAAKPAPRRPGLMRQRSADAAFSAEEVAALPKLTSAAVGAGGAAGLAGGVLDAATPATSSGISGPQCVVRLNGSTFRRPLLGAVTFEGVGFKYPPPPTVFFQATSETKPGEAAKPVEPPKESAWILRDFSLSVRAGQQVALVGPSGCGKSTLVKLLLKLQEPQEGTITIDGLPSTAFDSIALRRCIGYVPQASAIMARSVRDNILYGCFDAGSASVTPEEAQKMAERAAQLACIHDDILKLPFGYDTVLPSGGGTLSGGQKQRICLARALARQPSLLILDEATSALDAENEAAVTRGIESAARGRTVIIIAHRLSTVVKSDVIFFVEGGTIKEAGSHYELCARKGRYAEFVEHQLVSTSADGKGSAAAAAGAAATLAASS